MSNDAPSSSFVKNAGIVLANGYIKMLFDRLGILEDNKIKLSELGKAVDYLQYLTTGRAETKENLLPLNNVLCGMKISETLTDTIEISNSDKELIDGLINAMIGHWSSTGDTSIDGFRGNWLLRDGSLIEQEDRWELVVEKRAYDILLNQSPFSFSIIRLPWMNKPLHVTWPY